MPFWTDREKRKNQDPDQRERKSKRKRDRHQPEQPTIATAGRLRGHLDYPLTPEDQAEAARALAAIQTERETVKQVRLQEAYNNAVRASEEYTQFVYWLIENIYTSLEQPTALLRARQTAGSNKKNSLPIPAQLNPEAAFLLKMMGAFEERPNETVDRISRLVHPVRQVLLGVLSMDTSDPALAGRGILDLLQSINRDILYFWTEKHGQRIIRIGDMRTAFWEKRPHETSVSPFSSQTRQVGGYEREWIWQQISEYLHVPHELSSNQWEAWKAYEALKKELGAQS